MHRLLLALIPGLLAATLAACSSDGSGSDATPRSVVVASPAPTVVPGVLSSAPGTAAAPQTCPADASVFCDAGCCASGQTCAADGGCAEPTAAAACPAAFPVACASAESCAGGSCFALDSSGNNRTLTVRAPAGFVPGRYGTGVSTNLSTGCSGPWIDRDAGGLPAGNAAETVELWVSTDGGAGAIYGQGAEAEGRWLLSDGTYLQWPWGSLHSRAVDGGWHFVAATWDDGRNTSALYVDGVLQGTNFVAEGTHTAADSGVALGGNCNPFPGVIDELRVLSFAADGGQIAADYDAGRLGVIAGTVGLWHFDEGESQGCCPAGSACDPQLGCTGQDAGPLCDTPCDGGFCCPGEQCTAHGCGQPSAGAACPSDAPVDCGNGNCCPANELCDGGACILDLPDAATPRCSSWQVAVAFSSTQVACCNTPPPGAQLEVINAGAVSCDNGGWSGYTCLIANGACTAGSCATAPYGSCCPIAGVGSVCATNTAAAAYTCVNNGVPCTGDATHPGGCCPSGTVCGGQGQCCPSGQSICGAGCCPSGQCVNGSCVAPPAPKSCSPACPSGTVCNAGDCIAAPPLASVCGNGTPCGATCCPNGESCIDGACAAPRISIVCPDNLPSQCGPAGPCCRAGFTCFGNAGPGPSGFYCVGQFPALHSGPQGPACGGDFCDEGLVCGGGGLCCPAGEDAACGDVCCTAGETCSNGRCGCPSGQTACGTACCPADSACVGDACVPVCSSGTLCGGLCCQPPYTCQGDACSCPDDHPLQCGTDCCLSGATCSGTGTCSCPPGRASCGADCCASGESCVSGSCVAPGAGGGCAAGFWSGTYSGVFTYAGGGTYSYNNSPLNLLVDGSGIINATQPVDGQGVINCATGQGAWQATANSGQTPYQFTGIFNGSRASGSWSYSIASGAQAGSARGTWSATLSQ